MLRENWKHSPYRSRIVLDPLPHTGYQLVSTSELWPQDQTHPRSQDHLRKVLQTKCWMHYNVLQDCPNIFGMQWDSVPEQRALKGHRQLKLPLFQVSRRALPLAQQGRQRSPPQNATIAPYDPLQDSSIDWTAELETSMFAPSEDHIMSEPQDEETWYCTQCGWEQHGTLGTCRQCGTSSEKSPPEYPSRQTENDQEVDIETTENCTQ